MMTQGIIQKRELNKAYFQKIIIATDLIMGDDISMHCIKGLT